MQSLQERFDPVIGTRITDYDASFFINISKQMRNLDSGVIFLLGINYNKFSQRYRKDTFLKLARVIQESVNTKRLDELSLERIYRVLFTQQSVTEVLDLPWFRKEQKAIRKTYEEDAFKTDIKQEEAPPVQLSKRSPPSILDKFRQPGFSLMKNKNLLENAQSLNSSS